MAGAYFYSNCFIWKKYVFDSFCLWFIWSAWSFWDVTFRTSGYFKCQWNVSQWATPGFRNFSWTSCCCNHGWVPDISYWNPGICFCTFMILNVLNCQALYEFATMAVLVLETSVHHPYHQLCYLTNCKPF